MQAVITSRSQVALQTSLDGKLLSLISSATVLASAGQKFSRGLLTFLINRSVSHFSASMVWRNKGRKADGIQQALSREHH